MIAADFENNNGLVLGPVLPNRHDSPVTLALYIDEQLVGEGSAASLPGGLHRGLATALNILARTLLAR